MKTTLLSCVATASMIAINAIAPDDKWTETDWSAHLAKQMGGIAEFRTPDGSRVDILTESHAYEVEWAIGDAAQHWQSGVGQAWFYAITTNRQPAILLLVDDSEQSRVEYLRCAVVCAKLGIRLETHNTKSKP